MELDATWSVAGAPQDPDTVTLFLRHPGGMVEEFALGAPDGVVTRTSAGVYKATIVVSEPGRFRYRWLGGGAAQAAEERSFIVRRNTVGA